MSREKATFPFVEARKLRRAAILCHRHADPDAYLSAYALSHLIRKISPATVDIITPEGMSTLTKQLQQTFPSRTLEESQRDYDLFVAVDIGHTELLKNWLGRITRSGAMKILIDHHPEQKGSIYDRMLVDANASSTAEMVLKLYNELNIKPGKKRAQALLVGILFDSQHLAISSGSTLRACVELLDEGAEVEEARRLLRSPPDYGEVIAKLKGAKRLRIFRLNNWVLALSRIGSFQSHVARALVHLGADVALAVGDFENETRGSLRSNQRFYDSTKIHLGTQVAEVLSKERGYGGGHATAASFTSSSGEGEVLKEALALISKLLNAQPVEVN
ncbi:MAG: DHH family phosphoesterase [Thaumarchaeota archaeon]|nr:DHH family phosphoesterase [Nitrososphaerota archaeon]